MINLEEQFSPRVNPADANYPFGSIKDNTSPGANDGTPLAAVWGNDWEGFAQAAMTEAGITPSGLPDTAQDSQLLDAVKAVTSGALRDELNGAYGANLFSENSAKSIFEKTNVYEYEASIPLVVGTDAVLYQSIIYQPTVSFTTTGSWLTDRANLEEIYKSTLDESAFSVPSSLALSPRTSASDVYFFGDSHTAGSNAATGVYYTDGAGKLLPKFRWSRMFCANYGSSAVEKNMAVGGQRLGYKSGGYEYSIFNQLGNLGPFQPGIDSAPYAVCVMGGWNSVNAYSTGIEFLKTVKRAHEANIARLLMDGWGAITHLGWADQNNGGRTGGAFSFVTTAGTSESVVENVSSNKLSFNPFYYGDQSGGRWVTRLTNGQYSQVTFSNKRAACVFLETDPANPGVATISVDTGSGFATVATVDCKSPAEVLAYNDDRHPISVFIDNLPSGNTSIRVTAESGGDKSVRLLAIGYVEKSSSLARQRTIIYGTTVANSANQHDPKVLYACAKQCEAAVATFSEFGVMFANPFNWWIENEDQEPQDISHLTPSGNRRVAKAFLSATKLSYIPSDLHIILK